VCLSKGLGAPVGSVLCGNEALIETARRNRKMLGGGMRQAGILAAAGIYALKNNIHRLNDDHEKAQYLAQGLSGIDEITVHYADGQTNMVFIEISDKSDNDFVVQMKNRGILLSGRYNLRLVTHLDISQEDINYTLSEFKDYFGRI
jgi:threonine aldolase